MKATSQEYQFHLRMLSEDDPTAFAELSEWLYPTLVAQVKRRATYPVDLMLIEEAVGQALLTYNDAPSRYNPERLSLEIYLVMAAYRDYQNAIAKEYRRGGPAGPPVSLDEGALPQHELLDEQQDLDSIATNMQAKDLWNRVHSAFPDPIDQKVITLIINGAHSQRLFARALGIEHLPSDEQTKAVKRVKDRITRKLRRMGDALNDRP